MTHQGAAPAIARFVTCELESLADPDKAGPMQAYMKTDMPFFGVPSPERKAIVKEAVKRFPIGDRHDWEAAVTALWERPHREEKYVALALAGRYRTYHTPEALPLCERIIREGAWWDFVDAITSDVVAPVQRRHRDVVRPIIDAWIDDDLLWIRRAAILSQLKLKAETDADQLFGYCLRRAGEKEFFIRKAIGWALRDFSYAAPELVRDFLVAHESELSGLSYREGKKRLVRVGLME